MTTQSINSETPNAAPKAVKGRFKTRLRHRTPASIISLPRKRPAGDRTKPVLFEIPACNGVEPDPRPAVRIYVGTEPAQYAAERTLIWSVLKHRNPARTYQIYLMSELLGFDRSQWKTGFSQYRYAIPALAGCSGRAIYNDVDQIYLSDPAELFDLDMGGNAVLSIDERETSVMLLDCERLKNLWLLEDTQRANKHKFFRARVQDAGMWGFMPSAWNARDGEYVAGESKLVHFTILHKQPWHPFPAELRYEPHELADLWAAQEREADEAGFTVFTAQSPSERQRELLQMYATMHDEGRPETGHSAESTFSGHSLTEHIEPIGRLVAEHNAATVLDYGCGKASLYQPAPGADPQGRFKSMPTWGDAVVTCYDPGYAPFSGAYESSYDGVITTDVLEHIPAEDIQWVLQHLFAHAGKFLYAVAACFPAKKILPDGTNAHCTIRSPQWWAGQMELAARNFPHTHWLLCTQEKSLFAFDHRKRLTKKGIRSRYFSNA